jgi:hypothetical protein
MKVKKGEQKRRRRSPWRENQLTRTSWLAFLARFTHQPGSGPIEVNGHPLEDSARRALHRWKKEGTSPTIFGADHFLTRVGLHLDDYFAFCSEEGISAWARGVPPAWLEDQEVGVEVTCLKQGRS